MSATLAARVKDRREALGLSQRQLPGLDQSTLSRIESGKLADPGLDVLGKLAKGLGLTVEELATGAPSVVQQIELRALLADPNNPRTMSDDDAADLAFMESIRLQGLIQPLAVRRIATDWMVVDGHRRLAALIAIHGPRSKTLVPCRVVTVDGNAVLLMQLVANVQRADMAPWDLAQAIGQLVEGNMDTQAIADALGRRRRWVQEMASVGRKAITHTKQALQAGTISISQAIAIVAAPNDALQYDLVEAAVKAALNEDDIRARIADAKVKAAEAQPKQVDLEELAPPQGKRTTAKSTWTHRRGHIEIKVEQLGEHQFAGWHDWKWRTGGGSGGDAQQIRKTVAVAFMVAARYPYTVICQSCPEHPEDVQAAIEAHHWISESMEKLGATKSDLATWLKDYPPPVKPKAKAAAPAPEPEDTGKTFEELKTPPAWARTMQGFPFVVIDHGTAVLCHGWAQMIVQVNRLNPVALDGIDQREQWTDSARGEPYEYGQLVFRCVETYGPT